MAPSRRRKSPLPTSFTDQDVFSYRWIGDRVIEMITADLDEAGGNPNLRRHLLIDVVNKVVLRDLMTIARFGRVDIVDVLDRSGEDLIVETLDRNVHGRDAFRYNARSGEKRLLTLESPGDVIRFVADRAGQVRIALSVPKGGKRSVLSYRRSNDDKWVTLRDDPVEDAGLDPIAFDFDNKTLYVHVPNKENGGKKDVYAYDPETRQLGARIFESKSVDAGRLVFDWIDKKLNRCRRRLRRWRRVDRTGMAKAAAGDRRGASSNAQSPGLGPLRPEPCHCCFGIGDATSDLLCARSQDVEDGACGGRLSVVERK